MSPSGRIRLWSRQQRWAEWRDLLVRSGALRLIMRRASAGTTSVPLQLSEGPACQVRFLEGRTCRVRCTPFDYLSRFRGHDKRAPPKFPSEGRACRVRRATFDNPCQFCGRDEHTPPRDGKCADATVMPVGAIVA